MVRAILGDAPARPGAGERLWIATAQGLQRLDPDTGRFESWRHDPRRAGSLASDDVLALAHDRRGRLWVGTSAGLDRLDAPGQRFLHFRLDSAVAPDPKHNTVLALATDRRGRLWVGTSVALETWQIEGGASRRRRLATDAGADSGPVRAILQDDDGVLWFGTGNGLLRHDPVAGNVASYRHAPRDPHSVIDDDIDALYQDRSGTLWVGTHNNGTSRVDLGSGGFERVAGLGGADGGRDDDKVYAVDSSGDAELWIGTLGGGLQRLDRRTGQATVFRHDPADPRSLPSNLVRAVHVDPDGTVWAATEAGLARLDPGATRFTVRHFGDAEPLLDNLRQVRRDRAGALWLASDAGLHRYDPAADTVRTFRNDLRDAGSAGLGRTYAVVEDRTGTLWVGSDSGLARFDAAAGRFTHFRHDPARTDSLSHNRVTYVFEDRAGGLWIGSAGGLDRFEPPADGGGRFRRTKGADGRAIDPVGAILEDDAGRLWISTTAGITRYDPATGRGRHEGPRGGRVDGRGNIGGGPAPPGGPL
jgi:ligand-binding sensor domain-containing protein